MPKVEYPLMYDPANGWFYYRERGGRARRVTVFDGVGSSTGGISDGDYGDVVVSGAGATWTLDTTGTLASYALASDLANYALLTDLAPYALTSALSAYTPTTRTINTTAPLTGGGDLSADRTLAISNFTGTSAGAVPSPGGSTGKFLRDDATWQTPVAGGGSSGTTTIDFGSGEGSHEATAVITGQVGILAGSRINAWVGAEATATHSSDEHEIMRQYIAVSIGTVVPGTGFTITLRPQGVLPPREQIATPITGRFLVRERVPRFQGSYTVHWEWS